MDFLPDLILFLGNQVLEFQSKVPSTPQSEERFRRNFFVARVGLMVVALAIASLLPAYFILSSYSMGILSNSYFVIALIVTFFTSISSLLIFPKIPLLMKQYEEKPSAYETIGVEDEIKHELGTEFLFLILTLVPVAHILFCSLTINRASNILEIKNSSMQRIRKLAANLAGYSVILFMTNSLVVSFVLMILGDTR